MKTIGFFNNKDGVGKTTLVYHLAWMLSEMGVPVVAADFDPQANLTSAFLSDSRLEEISDDPSALTVADALRPLIGGGATLGEPLVERVGGQIGLIIGDLGLFRFEDTLSKAWLSEIPEVFNLTGAFRRLLKVVERTSGTELALIDVGSGADAVTRAALLACDYVINPMLADQSSLYGLLTAAGSLRVWKLELSNRRGRMMVSPTDLPKDAMEPAGYVIMRHSPRMDRPPEAAAKWLSEIPKYYANMALSQSHFASTADTDPNCLGILKDFRSLMPLAHEARKPMFLLKPADGAFGGHQQAVSECYKAFRDLTERLLTRCNVANIASTPGSRSNAGNAASR